jgi:hypothetical protein
MKHKGKSSLRKRQPSSDEAQSGQGTVAMSSTPADEELKDMKEIEEIRFLRQKWEQNAPNSGSQPTEYVFIPRRL